MPDDKTQVLFDLLVLAAEGDYLRLFKTREKATGEDVYVACAVYKSKVVPLAVIFKGPIDKYEVPEEIMKLYSQQSDLQRDDEVN